MVENKNNRCAFPALYSSFLKRLNLLSEGTTEKNYLVAFSGGADSTALLSLFLLMREEKEIALSALHVHHGIRGAEADRDEAFCREFCKNKGVEYTCVYVDAPGYAAKEKKSLEESARILRYAALEKEAERRNAYIVSAHHADDLLETMLFHILRGSGGRGLSGMPEKRGRILRPLLYTPKEEIDAFLTQIGQDYITDSTNNEDGCTRNRLRHTVLQALKSENPNASVGAARLAQNLREDEEFLCSLLPEGEIQAKELEKMPPPLLKRYIARSYRDFFVKNGAPMLEQVHLEKTAELIYGQKYGKSLSLPGKVKAVYDRAGLHFHTDKSPPEAFCFLLKEGENRLPGSDRSIYLTDKRRFSEFSAKIEKVHNLFTKIELKADTINGMLTVRTQQAGDKIFYSGQHHSARKVIASLCRNTEMRKVYPVICDDYGIVWIPGAPQRDRTACGQNDEYEKIYILMGVSGYGLL